MGRTAGHGGDINRAVRPANRAARSFRSEALSKVLAPFAAMRKVNAVTQMLNEW